MKFEQKDEGFQPVTITLETEEEVQMLAASLAKVGDGTKRHSNLPYRLYCYLTDVSDYCDTYKSIVDRSGVKVLDA